MRMGEGTESAYRRVADAVGSLVAKIGPESRRMPIGLDGAVIEHLFQEYCGKYRALRTDELDRTVQISSRSNEADRAKLHHVLGEWDGIRPIYAVDMRTKTGSLSRVLKELTDEFYAVSGKKVDLLYTVLFDPSGAGDLRVSREEMGDGERLDWLPSMDYVEKVFHNRKGGWRGKYDLSHEKIHRMAHVRQIEAFL